MDGDGLNFLAGQSVDYILERAMDGTLLAHTEGGVPNLIIEMEKTNCGCKDKNEDKKECKYLRKEFSYSKFSQTLLLPDDIDKEGIEAHVCNGILKIRIKKTEKPLMEDQKKVIEVK